MINTPKRGKTGGSARGRTSAGNTGRGLAEISDRCLLLLMFRHGLRVSEACGMKLDQVDTESRVLHVARLKGGLSTTQPLRSDELRAISAWLKERARMKPIGKAFFVSEQRKQLHRSTVNLLMQTYSKAASLPLLAHPHMLRHACGFALADQGADIAAHSGLSRTPEYSAHRQVHGHQPGTVREVVAMNLKFPVVSQFEFPLSTARIRWRRRSRTSTCQNEVGA